MLTQPGLGMRTAVRVLADTAADAVTNFPAVARSLRKQLVVLAASPEVDVATDAIKAIARICGEDSPEMAAAFTVRRNCLGCILLCC